VIFDVGTHNIYISLLIASILPLVLGTALPVVPTYLLSVSILSPVLQKLGVDIVAAHLFFIYWGVLGAVTPPTCEAAVVSAGIAKGDWLKTGFYACGLGAVAFCLPTSWCSTPPSSEGPIRGASPSRPSRDLSGRLPCPMEYSAGRTASSTSRSAPCF